MVFFYLNSLVVCQFFKACFYRIHDKINILDFIFIRRAEPDDPGARHEVFYDWCGEQMQKDVADFFDKFIIYEQTSIDDLCK